VLHQAAAPGSTDAIVPPELRARQYFQDNKDDLPIAACVAEMVLPMTGTEANLERAFHSSKLSLEGLRTSLGEQNFHEYIFIHLNWKHYPVSVERIKERYFREPAGGQDTGRQDDDEDMPI